MKVVILQIQQQQWHMARLLFLVLLAAETAAAVAPPPQTIKPECDGKCGNTSVPYPFGIVEGCYKSKDFELSCAYTDQYGYEVVDDENKKWRLWLGDFEILNISVETGTATTNVFSAYYCYNNSEGPLSVNLTSSPLSVNLTGSPLSVNLTGSPFTFSSHQNKFTGVGCDTLAIMEDGERFSSGCMSLCNHGVDLTDKEHGECSGVGCCRTQIPNGVKNLDIHLQSFYNFSYVLDFSPCSFAFLADQNWTGFTSIDLMDMYSVDTYMSPAVLDWVVGEDNCTSFDHHSNKSAYACGANTECSDSYNGPGYLCSCISGYEGNPYLPQGCQDVDECKDPKKYKCEGKCKNTAGNYTCHCQLGMSGDGKVGCKGFRLSTLAAVVGVCLSLVVTIFFLWMECKRRNKASNFHKNGGTLLKHQDIKIYKEDKLKKATGNYTQLIGQGASGSVYKGVLPDNSLVAIKKPKVNVDTTRHIRHFQSRDEMNKEFQHEISMICKVSHTNVVKLKGLCLETNVPLLVYEFISNGSLFYHIHTACSPILNSWKTRLRIACETALALDYLHSKAGTPIIHRDVKSMNILLDENFTVKVADFGSSVLIPLEQSVINTKVLGTLGYLDPEYLITSSLTIKSDVYSFGVVLMELLTSQKPISSERSIDKVNFIPHFISSVEQGNLADVLNVGGFDDCEKEMVQVEVVAELVVRCLNWSGVFRPDMNEVAEVLMQLMKLNGNNGGVGDQSNIEEMQSLLGYPNDAQMVTSSFETEYMTSLEIQQTPYS